MRNAEGEDPPHPRRAVAWSCLLLLWALVLMAPVVRAQTAESGLSGSFRFYPGSLWSSTMGVGIGVGYELEGITGSTSSLLLIAKPSVHRGIYEIGYFTRDPYGGTPFLGVAAYYETTGRTRFYGIGPFTDSERRVFIKDELLRLRLSAGFPLRQGSWMIQPIVEFWNVAVDSFRNDDDMAFESLSERSQQALIGAARFDGAHRFGAVGLELGRFFTRNQTRYGSGVQGTFEWMVPLHAEGDPFFRIGAHVQFDEPIGSRQLLARMAFATILGDADEVPYFLLPKLGGRLMPGLARDRLRGNSFFVVNLGVEQPVFNFMDYVGFDLVLMGSLGNVYDDFADQFTPRVSFDKRLTDDGRVPLRPAIAAGVRLFVGQRLELTALAGTSPERLSVVSFRMHRDIRHRQGLLFR